MLDAAWLLLLLPAATPASTPAPARAQAPQPAPHAHPAEHVPAVPSENAGSKLSIGPNINLKGVEISNCDVAPTMAKLLKLDLPTATGKVLTLAP